MKTFRSILPAALLSLATLFAGACAAGDDVVVDDDTSVASDEVAIRPRFALWRDGGSAYQFALDDSAGVTLVTSQTYSSRTAALSGLLSVLDNGGQASHYEVRSAADGGAYFVLLAANRQVIATSDSFVEAAAARGGIDATISAVASYLEHWDTATGARYEVFEGADARFYFNVHAKNGAVILTSQGYTTEASALNGAFSVAENGVSATRYRVIKAVDGRYYFNIVASNGQVIATSQMYSSKYNAERARDALIALLPTIELL